jgi:hypothetical protein
MVGRLNTKGFDRALTMQCFSGHHQIRMMKSDLAGQFAVLSLIDASFAADAGFSGL